MLMNTSESQTDSDKLEPQTRSTASLSNKDLCSPKSKQQPKRKHMVSREDGWGENGKNRRQELTRKPTAHCGDQKINIPWAPGSAESFLISMSLKNQHHVLGFRHEVQPCPPNLPLTRACHLITTEPCASSVVLARFGLTGLSLSWIKISRFRSCSPSSQTVKNL